MSDDDGDRNRVGKLLESEAAFLTDAPGSVLVGYYLVSEWMDPNGDRWLSRVTNADSTGWGRLGLLRAATVAEETSWAED